MKAYQSTIGFHDKTFDALSFATSKVCTVSRRFVDI